MPIQVARILRKQGGVPASRTGPIADRSEVRVPPIGVLREARMLDGSRDLVSGGPRADRAARVQAMVDGSPPMRAQRQRAEGVSSSPAAVLQGLFLPEAHRDIEEDQMTLKAEWFRARDEKRDQDKDLIAKKQTETAVRPEAIMVVPTPEERDAVLKEELTGNRLAIGLFVEGAGIELCREVADRMARGANPMLPVPLMTLLRAGGWLLLQAEKYREGPGGQNGMIYTLYLRGSLHSPIGEWHVHWEAGNRAGSPGWKRGKKGEKTPTGDEMRAILGDRWGVVKGSGGGYV